MESALLQEERKLVSVLFVDVVGSTARADGADPEDVRDLNQLYYGETRARIERHGGVVEKYVGDAVMAVFGAPLARSDDAERAVHAALNILEGIEELNASHPGLDLHVRVAVCTGEAVVTVDASPAEALATGDIVNTAARLQTSAPPDGVVVGLETYRLTRYAFNFVELPPVVAKGKSEPVPTWRVVGAIDVRVGRPTSSTPLVGRDRELVLLEAIWDRVSSERAPHLITVLGPAGIGKTRLGREVSGTIERLGGRVLWGRSLPYEEQSPYRAFADIVRRAASIFENDVPESAREKLNALIMEVVPPGEVTEAARYLPQLLGLSIEEGTGDETHLYFAARRLVESLAAREPLLLVFEDVHWADDALMTLLDYLVSRVADRPVAFLALARPELLERHPSWGAGMMAQIRLPLEPLTSDEASRVAASLLGDQPETVARVVARAEGNPLFLEELIASMADEGGAADLPATVRAAIAARIDALPPDVRATLLHASVIGQSFWRGVVEQTGELHDVDAALEALEARGLIQRHPESQVSGDTEFAFKHVLIRDVAYATLPRALRRDLHAAIAGAIEGSVADPAELAWVLAVHWREGGNPHRAMEYLITAGDRAAAALAAEQTYDLYSRALDLATSDEDRRRILLRRGLALTAQEDFPRADEELKALIPVLEGEALVEALVARARATFWTEQTDETFAMATAALEGARALGSKELEPVALARLSGGYGMRGEPGDIDRAIELGNQALERWVPGTRVPDLAEHSHMQADNLYWVGDHERSLALSERASQLGGLEEGSAEFLLRGVGMKCVALSAVGRYEDALEAGAAAIAIAERMGRSANGARNYSTLPLRDIFWLDEAARRSAEVLDRIGRSWFNMPWMNARTDAVSTALLAGDIGTVERDWPSIWEDASQSRAWDRWVIGSKLAVVRAYAELAAGRPGDAVEWARRARDFCLGVKRWKYVTDATVVLGRSLAATGATDEALEVLREAVTRADGPGGTPLLRWRARAALGEVGLGGAETGAEGEARLGEAAAQIEAIARSLSEERAAHYLEAPQVREVLDRVG
jgi:class 3 adenylate cyclase/tetratricopeptide (TPR) repeat protein